MKNFLPDVQNAWNNVGSAKDTYMEYMQDKTKVCTTQTDFDLFGSESYIYYSFS